MTSSLRSTVRHAAGRALRSSPEPLQNALRRSSARLLAALGEVPPPPASPPNDPAGSQTPNEPVDVGPVWRSPAVPVPDGLTYAKVEAAMKTWSIDGEPPGHMDHYLGESICRFLYTWSLARGETGTCLELGANPYFTTYLLDEHTDLDLTLANYFGEAGETTQSLSYVPAGRSKRVEVKRHCALFNVEEDEFPFPDDSFDVVLFCEMLEHLLMNPLATLAQIRRVLKPSGLMILTTPNVARIENATAMVEGKNVYGPYSGFGPYGRHNREYTQHELHRLMEFAGFEVERSFTADGHKRQVELLPRYGDVAPLLRSRSDLGQYMFLRARATGTPHEGLPSFLYASYPEGTIVEFN